MLIRQTLLAAASAVALLAAPALAQDNSEAGPGNAAQDAAFIGDTNAVDSYNQDNDTNTNTNTTTDTNTNFDNDNSTDTDNSVADSYNQDNDTDNSANSSYNQDNDIDNDNDTDNSVADSYNQDNDTDNSANNSYNQDNDTDNSVADSNNQDNDTDNSVANSYNQDNDTDNSMTATDNAWIVMGSAAMNATDLSASISGSNFTDMVSEGAWVRTGDIGSADISGSRGINQVNMNTGLASMSNSVSINSTIGQ